MVNFNNIFIPVLSPGISIFLFIGLFAIGKIISNFLDLNKKISKISDPRYHFAMLGSVFLTALIFPLIIFNILDIYLFLKIISFALLILGIITFISEIKFFKSLFQITNWKNTGSVLILFLILGYFLLALAPITNADSLDYHIGVPLYVINNNEYPSYQFWMHFLKSGSGELLNAVGLIIKAEQFPALVQFSGILSICGILKHQKNKVYNNIFLLLFLSSPILILLVSSAKIQLNYVAASSLLFSLIFFGDKSNFKSFNFLIFIKILLFSAINAKFSFALSSFLLWMSSAYICFKLKRINYFLTTSFIIFLLVLCPKLIWKIDVYEMGAIEALTQPLPLKLYGYQQLHNSLTACGSSGCIPYWLFFPANINTLTEFLGIGSFVFLFTRFRKKYPYYTILIVIISYIILAKQFGQNNPRWFLEPFVWIIISIKNFGIKKSTTYNFYYNITKLQSFIVLLIITYGVATLSIGSLSTKLRDNVLSNSANGYDLFKWSNSKLKKKDILISTHRSFALSNVKTIPGDIFNYVSINDPKSIKYFMEIKKIKPTHILFYDDKKYYNELSGCLGNLLHFNNKVSKFSTRNPFNKRDNFYAGFIYKFEYEKLPYCLNISIK